MKKFLTLGFAAVAAIALSTGCQKKEAAAPESAPAAEAPAVVEETGTAATTTTTTGTESTTTTTTTTSTETAPATATPAPSSPARLQKAPRPPSPGASLFLRRAAAAAGAFPLHSVTVLPVWAEALLLLAAAGASLRAWRLGRRVRALAARLQARERGSHFLGESPDPQQILQHAYRAARDILPLDAFDLYRVDQSQRIHEVWTLTGNGPDERRPTRAAEHPYLGEMIDSRAVLRFAATETDRSFAPMQLLPGAATTERLHLPLYSGDSLVAYLTLGSPEPVDEGRKAEIRALLAPLTASLHASRNWEIAVTDELSGLFSRRYFETRLAEEWARHLRYGAPVAIACFDLDHFKNLNDTLGHAAGDAAIRRFGEVLREAVRSSDLACRHGGEEFAVLFPETTARAALAVAERVRRNLEREPFSSEGRPFRVTVSAGVADTAGLGQEERHQILFRADKALYAAKDEGRNRVCLWTERRRAARPRRQPPRA